MKDLAGLTKLICLCFKLSPITSFEPKNTYTSPHVSQKPPLSHVNLLLTINFGHVRDPFQGKDAGCKISRLVFFFLKKKDRCTWLGAFFWWRSTAPTSRLQSHVGSQFLLWCVFIWWTDKDKKYPTCRGFFLAWLLTCTKSFEVAA